MKDINKNNYNQAYSSCKNGSEMNLRKKKILIFSLRCLDLYSINKFKHHPSMQSSSYSWNPILLNNQKL